MDTLRITITRTSQPVILENEDGSTSNYVLKEMTGALRDAYLNAQRQNMETGRNGLTVIKNFSGSQSSLICRCLYDDKGKPVNEQTIQSWGVTVQTALHEAAQKINHLERVGAMGAMQRIYVILAQPDMEDADKIAAINEAVQAWRAGTGTEDAEGEGNPPGEN